MEEGAGGRTRPPTTVGVNSQCGGQMGDTHCLSVSSETGIGHPKFNLILHGPAFKNSSPKVKLGCAEKSVSWLS